MKNLLQEDISNIRRVMGLSEALGAPIETLNVSSEFNKPRKGYKHHGVDLSTPSGTNVVAIDGGTVIDAEIKNDNCGGTLYIEHPNGYKSRFCHLKQINVKKGDKVSKGQVVALSGGAKGEKGAGRSTGPHLHFELYKD
jgi:murein DD-endopeptidase MepM/ murein hydrolase activator NlpD